MLLAISASRPTTDAASLFSAGGSLRAADWRPFGSMWLSHTNADGGSNEWRDSIGFPASISGSALHQVQIVVAGSPLTSQPSRTIQEHPTSAESLLDLYLSGGLAMLDKIHGAFACVIADGRERRVYLARDMFGFVPLFHWVHDDILYCSTSLCELIEAVRVEPGINPVGLLRYYLFRYVAPPLTLYQDIKQVAPGYCVVVSDGQLTAHRYASFPRGKRHEKDARLIEGELREAIARAVSEQCGGRARLSVALSGGLDSSLVAASLPQERDTRVQAFTLRRRRLAQDNGNSNDAALAALCRRKGLDLSSVEFDACDFALLPQFLYALQEPVCVFPLFYLFLLLRGASGSTERILLGEGGDELFLGYRHQTRLLESFIRRELGTLPRNGSLRKEMLVHRLARLEAALGWKPERELVVEALACLPGEPRIPDINAFLDALVEQDLTCYPYFFAGARLGASFGVDVRCPLLHPAVINSAFSLGWEALVTPEARNGLTKPVLRNAFRGEVPGEILARRKEGFGERWNEHGPRAREFAGFYNAALERLEAAGIPVGRDARARADRLEGESLDLFWHSVYLGVWFESTTAERAQRISDSLRGSLAEASL